MNCLNDVTRLIRQLPEPERRELAAWLTESLQDSRHVAEPAPRYGAPAQTPEIFSVEEYLALEETSSVRHEYAAGQIYAMSEPLKRHQLIAGNIFAAVHAHLRDKPCRAYMEKIRVNIKAQGADYFYYPDIVVGCGQTLDDEDEPIDEYRLVVEVMSRSTERTDRREKALVYRELPSIQEIVLISQGPTLVTAYRRIEDWAPVILASLEQALELKSIDLALPLRQIYEKLP
jgi:Uma2 family endonuclease